jgi:hemerythrin-like metal-binding protein
MRHFTWGSENEVFLAQIDAEHRELFRIAGGLEQAVTKGAPAAEVQHHLQALVAHAEDHFSHEEWLMQESAYPSYGWHKQQHETARRRFKLFIPLIEQGEAEAADLFLEFLSGWLQEHTGITDRMMAAHIRNYERAHGGSVERWEEPPSRRRATATERGPFPTTIHYCRACGDQTTHELRASGMACLKCAERSVSADLDRE